MVVTVDAAELEAIARRTDLTSDGKIVAIITAFMDARGPEASDIRIRSAESLMLEAFDGDEARLDRAIDDLHNL